MSEQKKSSDFPSAEFRFFIYDHCNGDFTYYRTPEERDAASDAVIHQYLDDGWDEDVEHVVAGEVTAVATKVNVIERPPEDQIDDEGMDEDGRFWGEEHDYCCNYELLPLPNAPGDTAAPEQASLDCDYHGSHFGAVYPDAQCIDGYLWDEDSCDEPGGPLSVGGDIPCPKCNAAEYAEYLREDGDGEAPEQAEQPHPVNRSVIRDVFLRNGFTIKEGHSDLKPYVYAAAEELLALDGKEVAAEQDAVTVPRELLERVAATLEDCAVAWDEAVGDGRTLDQMRKDDDITLALPGELRALLGGGE